MNLNVAIELHNAFKSITAGKGVDMTTVLIEFIESYVSKQATSKKKRGRRMKRALSLYEGLDGRSTSGDPDLDLRQMASQRGYEIVHEYTDRICGTKAAAWDSTR